MLRNMVTDPAALFRNLLGEWERIANSAGADLFKTDEWSRAMNGANQAGMEARAALTQASDRALAAVNLVSRTEFTELSARIGRIEEMLHRIEAHLLHGAPPVTSARPKPTRGRKPPGLEG